MSVTTERVGISVRIDPTDLADIDRIARREERSRSDTVRRLLRLGIRISNRNADDPLRQTSVAEVLFPEDVQH